MQSPAQEYSLIWFRNNIRVTDNPALELAKQAGKNCIAVYVFPDIEPNKQSFGFRKVGVHRAKFILEALADLKERLLLQGIELLIRTGNPSEIIAEIAIEYQLKSVFAEGYSFQEEKTLDQLVAQKLNLHNAKLYVTEPNYLLHPTKLPFPLSQLPDNFTAFRKIVEPRLDSLIAKTERIYFNPSANLENPVLTLEQLGFSEKEVLISKSNDALKQTGGESAGLNRLHYYLWETGKINTYKETRNGLLGTDFSTRFSIYLAQGCLSTRTIYNEIRKFEKENGANESTYWVIFELLWREYFHLVAMKYGNRIFFKSGLKGSIPAILPNQKAIDKWVNGKTSVPFIDANMRELAATGFMSNRGRQNVASYFINDLKQDWRIGAAYFEQQLIDYDPASNYGNWNYLAGVGTDPRANRYFNIEKQARQYDPDGEYTSFWLK